MSPLLCSRTGSHSQAPRFGLPNWSDGSSAGGFLVPQDPPWRWVLGEMKYKRGDVTFAVQQNRIALPGPQIRSPELVRRFIRRWVSGSAGSPLAVGAWRDEIQTWRSHLCCAAERDRTPRPPDSVSRTGPTVHPSVGFWFRRVPPGGECLAR